MFFGTGGNGGNGGFAPVAIGADGINGSTPLQGVFNVVNAPTESLLGRPLIANGANAAPGSGLNGGAGGLLMGNGGAGGSGAADPSGGAGGAAGLLGAGGAGGAGGYSTTGAAG
ncbi:PGRS repeat-containing protein, partial [Mycobacterium helveticum]|uniref:PGRS repeat-containing protein n=1 Tax=Mycobacterium helveticum TaxID=2592811 RepID=UPI00319DBF23